MKRILQVSAIILIYLLLCAKSCDNQEQYNATREQNMIKSAKDSLTSAFGTDTLSATTLNAFEEKAKLTFYDFMDYLSVLSDEGTAKDFREHARQMIREQFRSDAVVLCFIMPDGTSRKKITMAELAGKQAGFPGNICALKPDSVWVIQELHPVSDSVFAGRLGFSTIGIHTKTGLNTYYLAGSAINFFAIKREKSFGKDTLKVWTIFLGENN